MVRLIATLIAALVFGFIASAQSSPYPPTSDVGQCFTRVLGAPVTETVVEDVLVQPESYRIEVSPAVYETRTERVLIREAETRHHIVPAVFETVTEQVLVSPERVEKTVLPAEFETYTETVIVEPERVVWKPGTGLYGRSSVADAADPDGPVSETTGEVLCRVTIPAKTETLTRVRMIAPPRVEDVLIPAQYETIERTVLVTPARVEEEIIPAVYEEREVTMLVQAAEERRIAVPAVYETVEREVVTSMAQFEWAEVLCDTNADRYKVAEIQGALTDAGYPTRIDGIFGPLTSRAMVAFQKANGLASGYMTVDTARALDIDPYGAPPDTVYAALGGHPPPDRA